MSCGELVDFIHNVSDQFGGVLCAEVADWELFGLREVFILVGIFQIDELDCADE